MATKTKSAIEIDTKAQFDKWVTSAKGTANDFLKGLKGKPLELTKACVSDLAYLKMDKENGVHVGQEAAFVESSLQDLKALVALETLIAMRNVLLDTAGAAKSLFEGMFERVLTG